MRNAVTIATSLFAGIALGWWLFAPGVQQASAQLLLPPPSTPPKKTLDLNVVDDGIYRVRSVIDGDTIVLENGMHLRYNGVNAPESGRWVRDPSPISKEATAKNIELVEGKRVRIHLAPDPIDMHGRLVASIYVVPESVGESEIEVREVLLKNGLAKVMGLGVSGEEYKRLKEMQDEAKTAEAGMWGVKNLPKVPEEAQPYCASSNSKIFHRATCSQAKRISAANLHEYASIDAAESVGLKPCSQCLGKK